MQYLAILGCVTQDPTMMSIFGRQLYSNKRQCLLSAKKILTTRPNSIVYFWFLII